MQVERARELLAAERRRLERALAQRARQDDGEESDPFFARIPDARLEARPAAELTADEERARPER